MKPTPHEPTFAYITIAREDDGRIAVVTMNRPEKRNALSLELMRELIAAFERIGEDRGVRAVILRAEGPAFSAGHDLRELQCSAVNEAERERLAEIFDVCVQLMLLIQRIPQPVIAEVATIATAAGCQLVATCDLALAAPEAKFATPGVRIGLFCTTPMVALTRAVGRKNAMEMLLTGDFIDAQTAANWGLVNRVVPLESLHDEAFALARKLGEAAASVVALGKHAFYHQAALDTEAAYAFAKAVMTQNATEPAAQEGMEAFLQRRKPCWPI